MRIYGSLPDFTTKGHGVIEGHHGFGAKKGSKIYTRVAGVPSTHFLTVSVGRLSSISPHISKMKGPSKSQLERDLYDGYVVKIRGGIFVKRSKKGEYEVYENPARPKSIKPLLKDTLKKTHKQRVDEAYEELLKIHKEAINKGADN